MSSTQAYFTHRDRLCIVTLFSVCAWLDPLINQWSFFVKYVINVSFKLFLLTCRHYLVRNEYHKQSVIHLSRWIKRQLKLYSTSQTSNHLRFAGTGVLQEGQYQYFKNISMAFLDRRSWNNVKEFGYLNYLVAYYILTKHHTSAQTCQLSRIQRESHAIAPFLTHLTPFSRNCPIFPKIKFFLPHFLI